MKLRLGMVMVGALAILVGWVAQPGHALPSFARREGYSCQVCHFRMPEMNAEAYDYLRRGLRMTLPPACPTPRPGTPVAAETRALGEPLPLNWADYLSVVGDSSVNFARHTKAVFDAGGIDIWASGPLSRHATVAADLSFNSESGGVETSQVYAQYVSDPAPVFGSARIGLLQPFTIMTNGGGPSMTISLPLVLTLPSNAGSTWTPTTPLRALEVGAEHSGQWNGYLGIAQPQAEPVTNLTGIPPSAHTDAYVTAEYDFAKTSDSLSFYGYWGTNALDGDINSHFYRAGAFANVFLQNFKGLAGYVQGADRAANDTLLATNGFFILGEYLPTDQLGVYARYDYMLRDRVFLSTEHPQGPTVGVSWWALTQLNLIAEAQFLTSSGDTSSTLQLQAAWAF